MIAGICCSDKSAEQAAASVSGKVYEDVDGSTYRFGADGYVELHLGFVKWYEIRLGSNSVWFAGGGIPFVFGEYVAGTQVGNHISGGGVFWFTLPPYPPVSDIYVVNADEIVSPSSPATTE